MSILELQFESHSPDGAKLTIRGEVAGASATLLGLNLSHPASGLQSVSEVSVPGTLTVPYTTPFCAYFLHSGEVVSNVIQIVKPESFSYPNITIAKEATEDCLIGGDQAAAVKLTISAVDGMPDTGLFVFRRNFAKSLTAEARGEFIHIATTADLDELDLIDDESKVDCDFWRMSTVTLLFRSSITMEEALTRIMGDLTRLKVSYARSLRLGPSTVTVI